MAPNEEIGQQPAVQPPSLDDLFKALMPTREVPNPLPVGITDGSFDIDPALIRQWARNHGLEVADRGCVPDYVVNAYLRFQRSGSTATLGAIHPAPSSEGSLPRGIASAPVAPASNPRGKCPIKVGRPLRMYETVYLIKFVQWIKRDGTTRTEDALVTEVLRELNLPEPHSEWTIGRIRGVIQKVKELERSTKTSTSTSPSTPLNLSTPPGKPRGKCPITPGHPLSVYGTRNLVQFVQWIQRDGIPRTKEILIQEVIRELKLPGPASAWAVSRIKDIIKEATDQAPEKAAPAAKKPLPRPNAAPTSGNAARSCLSELAFELMSYGAQVRFSDSEDVLIVLGPESITSAVGARVEASLSTGNFIWGTGASRSSHFIKDYRGAARAILAMRVSSTTRQIANPSRAVATPARPQPTCPVPRGRSIFAYTDSEIIAFAKWMKDDGVQRPEYQLIHDIIEELSSSTQSFGALKRVREALKHIDQGDRASKAAGSVANDRRGPIDITSHGTSKHREDPPSVAHRFRSGRPITAYKQEELVALIRMLADKGDVNTYDDLIENMISELNLPARTPFRIQIIEEAATAAGWKARSEEQIGVSGAASFTDVVLWARSQRYELQTDREIPEHVIFQYNYIHPDRPYLPRARRRP
ncbi:hypothetical protein AB0395_23250 [Streptosporangium sp. NPDC051023]|uniref:Lsr2 family DNA-binding protein n=1 Tax=Streptosporangium sp. NPDC051023 TaxID=3155410 RepID=UPI00344B0F55